MKLRVKTEIMTCEMSVTAGNLQQAIVAVGTSLREVDSTPMTVVLTLENDDDAHEARAVMQALQGTPMSEPARELMR